MFYAVREDVSLTSPCQAPSIFGVLALAQPRLQINILRYPRGVDTAIISPIYSEFRTHGAALWDDDNDQEVRLPDELLAKWTVPPALQSAPIGKHQH